MINFRNILLVFAIVTLNGCIFSGKIWNQKIYQERFDNYFIEKNRIVFIGTNNNAYNANENYYYAIKDNEDINKIFKIGEKSKNLLITFTYPEAKGSKVLLRSFGVGFEKKYLSQSDIEFLYKLNYKDAKNSDNIGYLYNDITFERYPASQEESKEHELLPVKFKAGYSSKSYVDIYEKETPLQITGKVLITPFALGLDILLLPINVFKFIDNQVKESKTDYYCKGEFCGYGDTKNNSNKTINSNKTKK